MSKNILTDKNLKDWKHNLNIVLTSKKHKFVLLKARLPEPTASATKATKDAYEKWIASNDIVCCYILTLISNVLQQQHQRIQNQTEN